LTSLTLERLSVSYGSRQALCDVDLSVRSGECVLLAGASGSGKSTLLHCLNRLIPQCLPGEVTGRVLLDERPIDGATVAELSRIVGVVFQNPRTQLLNVRVEDEVAFGPRNLGLHGDELERRVAWALDAVGLSDLRPRTTHSLSGGERQRLAIAAVLAMGPRLLVLDEPMANLDVAGTRAVIDTVRKLNRGEGVTVIIVEHRLGPAAAIADRTVVLDGGEVAAHGPTDEVLCDRALLRRLGLRRPADDAQVRWHELVDDVPAAGTAPLVSLRGITAGEGKEPALVDLDLTIRRGDFLALVGDNGAGKTTLARVVAGLLKPRRGVVSYGGGRRPRPGSGVGMLFQDPTAQLLCDTVGQEVALGPRNLGRTDEEAVDAALAAVDLVGHRDRAVYALSLGEQQRLAVGAVLSMAPDLLILDEPTAGQDWGHMGRFMEAVRRLNQAGSTVLLITHDFKLVHHNASRLVVLDRGRVVTDGVPRLRQGEEGPACASA
jgi:energy-coupling factor transport system ATP-binding protein